VNVFAQFQRQLQDVRLIKDKNTGLSRGFCFVEFYSVPDAPMSYIPLVLNFIDQQPVSLTFADTSPGTGRRNGRNRNEDRSDSYGMEDVGICDAIGDGPTNSL